MAKTKKKSDEKVLNGGLVMGLTKTENKGSVVIYQSQDGTTKINVKFEDETVWLTQHQMAELFATSRTNVVEHIKHIYDEEELDEQSTCRNFRQVQIEGTRQVTRNMPFYNTVNDGEKREKELEWEF